MSQRLGISLRKVWVRRGRRWALRDISLALHPGERWALLGGNGAGKTQLLKVICGDVWPTPIAGASIEYRAGRARVTLVEAKARVAYVGAERQDKYARYAWNPRIFELIATGLHGTDLLLEPITAVQNLLIRRMLRECALTSLARRRFSSLSYGQQRIAILARALVVRPDWLLLDECYNGLDARYRCRIDAILTRARQRGQSWVVAAHRSVDLPAGTCEVAVLHDGRLTFQGPLRPADLARLEPSRNGGGRVRAKAPGELLIRLTAADLYVGYRPVLRELNWELRKNQHWAVIGANGAGKTSFLKLLYGDLAPAYGGQIERVGFPAGTPIEAWKRVVGYVSPELQSDYAIDVDIAELVASGRHASIGLNEMPSAADRRVARRWLEFFGLVVIARRKTREVSYGQLRRALFARALAASPRLLLLDEPLTGLDPRQRQAMRSLLDRLMKRGVSIVIAVHHLEDLPRGITHVLHLSRHARARSVGTAN
jgi:molybdate transport system ATP-binding protein